MPNLLKCTLIYGALLVTGTALHIEVLMRICGLMPYTAVLLVGQLVFLPRMAAVIKYAAEEDGAALWRVGIVGLGAFGAYAAVIKTGAEILPGIGGYVVVVSILTAWAIYLLSATNVSYELAPAESRAQ